MALANPFQNFQDWITQQWVVASGKKITPGREDWLMGPFGNIGAKGNDFVEQLAKAEGLNVSRKVKSAGIISDIQDLGLTSEEQSRLSEEVKSFYAETGKYGIDFSVQWNPFFQAFGGLLNAFFSRRIQQLNIPTQNSKNTEKIVSEIITLNNPNSGEVKYTFWYRSYARTGQILYSGIYTTCSHPDGDKYVKVIFPLPNGNATIILKPKVSREGALILEAQGNGFGDAGFYFLLKDTKGNTWSKYVKSFRDQLSVQQSDTGLVAIQNLTMWKLKVLQFKYLLKKDID